MLFTSLCLAINSWIAATSVGGDVFNMLKILGFNLAVLLLQTAYIYSYVLTVTGALQILVVSF